MRVSFVVLTILAFILLGCFIRSIRSSKPLALPIKKLLGSLLLPVVANVVIAVSKSYVVSYIAYSCYYIGVTWLIYFLIGFTMAFCDYGFKGTVMRRIILAVCTLDSISILLNFVFGHDYYISLYAYTDTDSFYLSHFRTGHFVHLGISYVLLILVYAIFIKKMISVSRIRIQRYLAMIAALLLVTVWQFIFIFIIESPFDESMIGYAICGIVFYFFSMEYFPFLLIARTQRTIVTNMNDCVIFFNEEEVCIYANRNALKTYGDGSDNLETVKEGFLALMDPDFDKTKEKTYRINRSVGKDKFFYEVDFHPVLDKHGIFGGGFAIIRDRTQVMRRIERERYLSTHDALTGLYNSLHLYAAIEKRLLEDSDEEYLVIITDIREFKMINDIFGWEKGNDILLKTSKALMELAGDRGIYGRIVGDKFGLLIRKSDFSTDHLVELMDKVSPATQDHFHHVVTHAGVYEVKDRGLTITAMFDRAAMAIETIKNETQVTVAFYDETLRDEVVWEKKVVSTLDEAMQYEEIVPYIQAQVDKDGYVVGGEVLVRWISPTEGFISPGRFIPVLEKTGLIARLDIYMWESACKLLKKWEAQGRKDSYLSINISPTDFYFTDVYETILALVKKYEISPERLHLEITEQAMMTDLDQRVGIIDELRIAGFIVEMDDFGSGYSSLNMLKDLPVDVLKLDMAFLDETKNIQRSQLILSFMLEMSKSLGIQVISEGVETKEQVSFLLERGCDMFQGFYFAKPVPFTEFEDKYINNGLYREVLD